MAPGTASTSLNATGPLGGIVGGRNFTFGPWVAGVEGSTMMTDFTGNGRSPASADGMTLRNYIQADLRGRAGYAFGRFLPYFAAGLSWGLSEQRDEVTLSENGRIPSSAWTAGAGLEYMLTDRLSLRGEYLYASTTSNARTSLPPCTACSQSLTGSMVRVGMAYYFH